MKEEILRKICDITEAICKGYFFKQGFDAVSMYFSNNTRYIGTEQDEYFQTVQSLFKESTVITQVESEACKLTENIFRVRCEFSVKSAGKYPYSQGTKVAAYGLFSISNDQISLCDFLFCLSPKQLRKQIENRERQLLQELKNVACYQKALEIENEVVFEINASRTEAKGNFTAFLGSSAVNNSSAELSELLNHVKEHVHKEDRAMVEAWWQRFYESGYPYQTEVIEYRYQVQNKSDYVWHRIMITPIMSENGKIINFIGRIKDINDRKAREEAMHNLSSVDSLTGLLNRRYTELAIDQYISVEGGYGALLMVDLDNFKMVNDNLGHYEGDQTLIEVAQILRGVCGKKDIIGRIGGDEFIVFLRKTVNKQVIEDKAEQIINALNQRARSASIKTTATIGISVAPYEGETFTILWTNADSALYRMKRMGKNNFAFFDEDYAIGK